MANVVGSAYDIIKEKINSFRSDFPELKDKSDDWIFSALCVRANYFKNPSLRFLSSDIKEIVVDGQYDGGVDAMLLDPSSEDNNLVLVQSKFYQVINYDEVRDAVDKLILFYKSMERGEYHSVNENVQRRFLTLNSEVGEESKVQFVFYTSAPKKGIRKDRIEKLLKEHFSDTTNFEIIVLFGDDVVEEIKELESRRPTVESGEIVIDKANNALFYGDEAAIVNVSAFSLKELYAKHNKNLLSRNLRYFVIKRDIDKSINETIAECPDQFWFKNNGVTIICDSFSVDGRRVKLRDFSIVNGGQTTTIISRSGHVTKESDFYLPCKIIQASGDTEDEKNGFILEIAKSTNSQKPIKQIDLKSNAPEQIRFANAMREVGVYYQTKRGETIPKDYQFDYMNADLAQIGKLGLAAIFQLPASSRNKPSSLYNDRFYNIVFNGNQSQIASIMRELLYVDYFFRKIYIGNYDKVHKDDPIDTIPFAHNARTICISFVALIARVQNGNISPEKIREFINRCKEQKAYDDYLYDIFRDVNGFNVLFEKNLFADKNRYDEVLSKLFDLIIKYGHKYYAMVKEMSDTALNETNFLKNDQNYYAVLKLNWSDIMDSVSKIYAEL